MERADALNVETFGFFQEFLYLVAVFADDVGIIATGTVDEVTVEVEFVVEDLPVEGTESTEGVGGEKGLVGAVVSDHNFGPMDHRSHHEVELMFAGGKAVAFGNDLHSAVDVEGKELFHHLYGLVVADESCFGIGFGNHFGGGGVVGFHMIDDHVIKGFAVQYVFKIFQK